MWDTFEVSHIFAFCKISHMPHPNPTIKRTINKFITWQPRHRYARVIYKWSKRTVLTITALCLLFFSLNWVFPLHDHIEYSTIITDSKGEVIHAFLTKDQKWRMKTELNEISPLLRKTIVEKEDKYFYSHPGINALAVGRAMAKNIFRLKRTSGASTITMQVARALEP